MNRQRTGISIAVSMLFVITAWFARADGVEHLPSGIRLYKGIVYCGEGVASPLTMDLFLPGAAEAPVPCVIAIQGGAFRSQNGQPYRPVAEYLAEHGFAAALISYRGRPDYTYRDTVADTKAAVRFIRKTGGGYSIDSERIGAVGRSAGGSLAVLLSVTGDVEELEGSQGCAGVSSRIQAAVGMAGVYDFVSRFTDPEQIALQPRLDKKIKTNGEWIGVPFAAENKHWQGSSAINYLDVSDPPVLLLHCKNDRTVPWQQSRDMFLRMRETGIPVEMEIYETGGHAVQPDQSEDPMERMVAFFRKTLRDI